ncbi:MAG: transcriptional repressor [Acidovorax sp.]|nr:transcriptional repressor [Acidovorax sp.]
MQRSTRQRIAIAGAFASTHRPLSPQEVLEVAGKAIPALGIATVYRHLRDMTESGELQAVHLPGLNPLYELATHEHHHHFQCNSCQRVFDIHECPGELSGLAPRGFSVHSHALTLYGECSDCRSLARKAKAKSAEVPPKPRKG